jgi:Pyruvate/2-oxoacid:ferredoxin oxidoreductase delta subunit
MRTQTLSSIECQNGFDEKGNREGLPFSRRIVKIIPIELRKKKIKFFAEHPWYKRFFMRLKNDSQFFRTNVQFTFVLLCVWIGVEFAMFVNWGTSTGVSSSISRPPGAEGFLPISALISLKYWWQTGIINNIHPAGLFIFIAIIAIGLILKKAFCSWLCPVGTLSESLWMLGKKIFGRNLTVNRWIDYPLRSLKYLLLFFFTYSIWMMDIPTLKDFIYSPYNKMADVKMYMFFAGITGFALWTIIILMVFSLFIKNFWCRYLCPYGALLGALSWLSPLKITRTASTCIDCDLCTKACPANINVHKATRVWSDECTSCLACVQVCPVKDTLEMRGSLIKAKVPTWIFGTLVAGVFVAITGLAILSGHWQNAISKEEYQRRFQHIDSPLYQHNRGHVPEYSPND